MFETNNSETTTEESSKTSVENQQDSQNKWSTDPKNAKRTFLKKKKKKKICLLCKKGCIDINYKDTTFLKNYLKKYNKILSHKISGNCLKHQHQITNAVKRARFVALLPFVSP